MRRILGVLISSILILTVLAVPTVARTRTVDCGHGADLQAAIDAARPGTTLEVWGTCRGNFVIDHDLTLDGTGDHPTLGGGQRRLLALKAATTVGLTVTLALPAAGGPSPGPSGRMAVVGEGGLRVIDLADPKRPGPVIASDAASEFSWSPDRAWIAYYGSDGLWLVRPDGREKHFLAEGYEVDGAQVPEWSPDSTRIAVSRTDEAAGEIAIDVIAVATGDVMTVTPPGWRAGGPRWSPDGMRILFGAAADATNLGDLYVVGADGSGLLDLTDDPTASEDYWAGEWSPDGASVLVSTGGTVGVIDPLGSPPRPLVPRTRVSPGFVTWWPNGGRVTFGDYGRTYVADLSSGTVELLVDAGPIQWSPDGRQFAFIDLLPGETVPKTRGGPAARQGLYVVASDQGGPPQLVAEDINGFAWEPVG